MVWQYRIQHPIGPQELENPGLSIFILQNQAAITQGDSLFLSTSGYIGRAQANASATMACFGVALEGAASGSFLRVVTNGIVHSPNYNFSGYVGKNAYVSTSSAGGLQTTPPASSGQIVQVVGQTIDQSGLIVNIQGQNQVGQTL